MQLEAAVGWLLLGNPAEAFKELAQLSPESREAPEALCILWDIQAQERNWPAAIATADRLIRKCPAQPDGFVKRAYALHEIKQSQDAWNTLHPQFKRFPDNWLIPYNLACYAAQLGRPNEALQWFQRALKLGNEREIRTMAMSDPDLETIRSEVEKLPSSRRLAS